MTKYPIKPSDINTDQFFDNSFGEFYTEVSANYLVRMAQQNGDWRDFTQEEINKFSKQNFKFNKLIDDGTDNPPIKQNENGSYSFTHKFIARCFLSSPAIQEVKEGTIIKAVAHFSGMLARGVVYTPEQTYLIKACDMYKPEVAGSANLNMWMQGPDDIEEMDAGEYPFKDVYDRMKKKAIDAYKEAFIKEA